MLSEETESDSVNYWHVCVTQGCLCCFPFSYIMQPGKKWIFWGDYMSLHCILKSLLQALWMELYQNSTIMDRQFFPRSNSYWVRYVFNYLLVLIFLYILYSHLKHLQKINLAEVNITCLSHAEVNDGMIYSVQLHLIKWLPSFHLVVKHSYLSLIRLNFCHTSQTGIYYCPLILIYLWNDLHGFCQCYLHIFIINTAYLGVDLIYDCLAWYAQLFCFHFWPTQREWER